MSCSNSIRVGRDIIIQRFIFFKKLLRNFIYHFVGALGGELNRNQQFARIAVVEFNLNVGK